MSLSEIKEINLTNNNHWNAENSHLSSVRFLPQTTTENAANTQASSMPVPAAVAEAVTVIVVDPERAKELTQAVAEQVRTLANSKLRKILVFFDRFESIVAYRNFVFSVTFLLKNISIIVLC